ERSRRRRQSLDDPLELIVAVEADDDASALPPLRQRDARPERGAKVRLDLADVRFSLLYLGAVARARLRLPEIAQHARDLLRLTYRQRIGDDPPPRVEPRRAVFDAQQRACVALADLAGCQADANVLLEREQSQRVRDGRAAAPHALRDLLLCHRELVRQPLERRSFF